MAPFVSTLITVFITSMIGSWHCVLMCGPLATACSVATNYKYHLGRIFTYATFGLLLGFGGSQIKNGIEGLGWTTFGFWWTGFLFLLFIFILRFFSKTVSGLRLFSAFPAPTLLFQWASKNPYKLGIVSVFLPCGWLWSFFIMATAQESAIRSALVMIVFGLGTMLWPVGLMQLMKFKKFQSIMGEFFLILKKKNGPVLLNSISLLALFVVLWVRMPLTESQRYRVIYGYLHELCRAALR